MTSTDYREAALMYAAQVDDLRKQLAGERLSTNTLATDYSRLLAGLHLIQDAYREYERDEYDGEETLRRIGQVLESLRRTAEAVTS